MPKKKKRPRKPPRPSMPLHRRSAPRGPADPDEPPLLRDVARMLRADHPLDLLLFASSLLAVMDRRDVLPVGEEPTGPSREELLESFLEVDRPETSALLVAIAELDGDEVLRRRVQREVQARGHRLPDWLERLTPLRVEGAVEQRHVLGDGDNHIIGVRTAAGHGLTVVAYVDHNLGTVVKDGFCVGEPLEATAATIRRAAAGDPDMTFADLDLAEARATVQDAIDTGRRTFPPLETDTWPASRPLVERILRELPTGGAGYEAPEWSEEERTALLARFAGSPHAEGLGDDDLDLVDPLLWFACDYGPGDPLRWSTVKVEIFLLDWLPRKVLDTAGFLSGAPAVLRRFIRFAHEESGIREQHTADALAAVDRFEPEYQRTIRSPRPQGPAALLAAMGVLDEDEALDWGDASPFGFDSDAWWAEHLAAVAGPDYSSISVEPLPDEPLHLGDAPPEARERLAEVAALTDACCDALLDVEHRTACRRLLVDVAAADPALLQRGRSDTLAAAAVWIVAKANGSLSQSPGGLTAKAVGEQLGVGSNPGQRAATMLRAISAPKRHTYDLALGTPRYLVAERRQWVRERAAAPS